VRFWDASAIVPLLVAEALTQRLQALAAKDPNMLVWWGSEIECVSAIARLERDGALSSQAIMIALRRLRQLSTGWHEIDPSDAVREAAVSVFIRFVPRTRYSLRRHSWLQNGDRLLWNCSLWMIAWQLPHGRKGSRLTTWLHLADRQGSELD
jgi:predicted nucleic acid-binding protein